MGKIKNRLSDDRSTLGDKLPVSTPYVLVVDPSSLCNLRCRFCPSGYDELIKKTGREQRILEYSLYCKMIDDLEAFDDKIRVLRLYKEGEPLVNPNFERMIAYAKKSGRVNRIDTTTNGVLFSKERNKAIIEAGIDQINISVNGISDEQIEYYTNRKVNFKEYVENIADLYENKGDCTIYIKAIKDNLTKQEQEIFLKTFENIADRVFLERLAPAWPDFECEDIPSNFDTGHYGQQIENRQVCPYIFYTIVVNSDGTVSSCVGDWQHKQILGNIQEEKISHIWKGENLRDMWRAHLMGEKDNYYMCRNCKVITHGCLDNIDSQKENIMNRLEEV